MADTSDITEMILAYRAGDMTFDALRDALAIRDYASPSWMNLPNKDSFFDEQDTSEAGTWFEVDYSYRTGLLTEPEFDEIYNATMIAHGEFSGLDDAEREVQQRLWDERHGR